MSDGGSIVEFFYNLIPGSIFLFSLKLLCIFDLGKAIKGSENLIIFGYLVLGIFLGFLFQGLTIIARRVVGWNITVFKIIEEKNSNFKLAYKKLTREELKENEKLTDQQLSDMFYLMDSSLRVDKASFLPTHFSSLFAFWANMFFAALLLSVILWTMKGGWFLLFEQVEIIILFVVLVIAILCLYFANRFLISFYDTILNCYIMKK